MHKRKSARAASILKERPPEGSYLSAYCVSGVGEEARIVARTIGERRSVRSGRRLLLISKPVDI